MRVMWMPYLVIEGLRGANFIKIGNASVYKDSEEVWESVIGISRPLFLNIYRKFPPVGLGREGDPVRGTVIISESDDWVQEYGDEIASVLYFLGDSSPSGRPAECFQYHHLDLKIKHDEIDEHRDIVRFYSKHGEKFESSDSIILYPPISVRGHSGPYRLLLDLEAHKNILDTFSINPMDRRIVAIRQYFRTQFSDTFSSTSKEDYAGYCSVFESALDLDTRNGAGAKFVEALVNIYSINNMDEYRDYFYGLYVARSIYVHGASVEELRINDDDVYTKMRFFETRIGNLTALRTIGRELILQSFGGTTIEFEWEGSTSTILAKILNSENLWKSISGLLSEKESAKKLLTATDEEFDCIEDMHNEIQHKFDWRCIVDDINIKKLKNCIIACVLFIVGTTGKGTPAYCAADDLGKICDDWDMQRLADWCTKNEDWKVAYIDDYQRLTVIEGIAYNLAMLSKDRF